jgi:hypothetical protein
VLGPSIYSVSGGYYQSPMENFHETAALCRRDLWKYRKIFLKLKMKQFLRMNLNASQVITKWDNPYYDSVQTDKTLHGSFLIFSKVFLDYYQNPFNSNTFLYMEENILKLRCEAKKLPMVYDPGFCVKHLQAQSSTLSDKSEIAKQVSRYKQLIRSLKIYIRELKEMQKNDH